MNIAIANFLQSYLIRGKYKVRKCTISSGLKKKARAKFGSFQNSIHNMNMSCSKRIPTYS